MEGKLSDGIGHSGVTKRKARRIPTHRQVSTQRAVQTIVCTALIRRRRDCFYEELSIKADS